MRANMKLSQNCLRCSKYFQCKDPAKSLIYSCQRFTEISSKERQETNILEDVLDQSFSHMFEGAPTSILVPTREDRIKSFDVFQALKSVLKDNRIVSPDIKVPEGDFPEAPNFYTWCVADKYLNQKPFLEQAIIGTILFAEYCPDCSDIEWLHHTHKVTDSLMKFERRVALLEHGKCPHCGKTRLQFFKKKKLNAYIELALSAGQRSGKSALTAMLTTYITHRVLKLERPAEVYGLLKTQALQGTFTALTFAQANDTLYQPFYSNILESPWFCLAENSQISMSDNSKKAIQDVRVGEYVKTLDGDGLVVDTFDNGLKECFEILTDSKSLIATSEHEVRCLSECGTKIILKKVSELTEDDYIVEESE